MTRGQCTKSSLLGLLFFVRFLVFIFYFFVCSVCTSDDDEWWAEGGTSCFFEGSLDRRLSSYAAVFDFERVSWILFCLHWTVFSPWVFAFFFFFFSFSLHTSGCDVSGFKGGENCSWSMRHNGFLGSWGGIGGEGTSLILEIFLFLSLLGLIQ